MLMQASRLTSAVAAAMLIAACATNSGPPGGQANTKASWSTAELTKALAAPSRPEADRARDADRKPAELMNFFGVKQGMTVVDIIAADGYLSEVLAVTVGPSGKVYIQNPPRMLQMRNGAADKALTTRLANNRLPNAVRADGDLPIASIPDNSVDFAITAMNLHDLYNAPNGATTAQGFMKNVLSMLKPGGVFGVIDHAGVAGGDNTRLHRMQKQQAIDVAKAAGFVLDAESALLASSSDDHTKGVFDPTLRGKTDQFVLRLRKPK